MSFNKTLTVIAIIIIGIFAVVTIDYISSDSEFSLTEGDTPSVDVSALTADEVSEQVIAYINDYILQGQTTASLIDVVEENKLYKLKVEISGNEFDLYASIDGKLLFPEVINLTEKLAENTTIGNFTTAEKEVCMEDGKPIVYFFGSHSCPHCLWEQPIIESVAALFGENISFHNNIDNNQDMNIFSEYSTGGVPTAVLGCKYWRVGSGQSNGEEGEAEILTALICDLTQNQPGEICDRVQNLINQIES